MAVLAVVLHERHHLIDRVTHPGVRARGQPPLGQKVVHLALRRDGRVRPRADAVHVEREGFDAQQAGFEFEAVLLVDLLTQATTRCVARVGERGESARGGGASLLLIERLLRSAPRLPALERIGEGAVTEGRLRRVEPFERGDGDEDLSAHLHDGRVALTAQSIRDLGQPKRVLRDDLPHASVAPGRSRSEHAVLIAEIDGEAVDLQLGEPGDIASGGGLRLRGPFPQLVDGEDVVEAEHALRVLDGREARRLSRPHHLCGRVLPLQLGMQTLELFESAHPAVVGGIVDDRGVAAVVGLLRIEDARGQLLGFGSGVFQRDVLRHPVSLRAGADTGGGYAPTGTADTVVSIVNCPSTRVPM